MNLSAMTLAELAELQQAFELIHRGTSILSGLPCNQSEFETSIDMTPGELVVISTHFRMPEAMFFGPPPEFVIEDAVDEPAPAALVAECWAGGGTCSGMRLAESAPADGQRDKAETCEAAPVAVAEAGESPAPDTDAAAAAGPGDGAGGDAPPVAGPALKTGPLSDEEKAQIRLYDGVMSCRDIAARLGRRSQTVALYLHALETAAKKLAETKPEETGAEESKAAQPAPGAEQASVADPVGADAAAETPEAVKAAPVGETAEGGAAVTTPDPAPVAGGADSAVPPPATLREREIWHHLNQLGHVAPFDAELDLEICEALSAGQKPGEIATNLGLDTKAVVERFRRLSYPVRDLKDRVMPDGQALLVAELRRRVTWMRSRAA